jgi:hypothetical protein
MKSFVECPRLRRTASVKYYCDDCCYRFSYEDDKDKVACTFGQDAGYELRETTEEL